MIVERKPEAGFDYRVSDELLEVIRELSMIDRLRRGEAVRRFTLAGQTPETRERMERLRRGEARRLYERLC